MVLDPVKIRNGVGRLLMWAALCAVALVPRLLMMFTVERRLDADESIVGLMAKHIAAGEGVPFFFYGQDYGGGHVIEALLAAPVFLLTGTAEWPVLLGPVLFSTATVLLVFVFVRNQLGGRAGFACAALFSFSVPYLKSSLKADGYIETMFLGLLAVVLMQSFARAVREKREVAACEYAALAGMAVGLGLWSYDFAVVYLAAVVLMSLRAGILRAGRAGAFAGGLAVGLGPLIAANLLGNWGHLKHFAAAGPGGVSSPVDFPIKLFDLLVSELPAFISSNCIHNFVYPAPWYSWLIYAAVGCSAMLIIGFRKRLHVSIALVPVLVIAAYTVSGYAGRSPRYLLALEPFLTIIPVAAAVLLLRSEKYLSHLIGAAIIIAMITGTIAGDIDVFRDGTIVEGNVETDPESLPAVVLMLENEGIDCIYTTYFIKWRILFLTDERINAVDIKAGERENAYLRYEDAGCPEDEQPSYVFHKHSRQVGVVASQISGEFQPYKVARTVDHLVMVPAVPGPDVPAGEE